MGDRRLFEDYREMLTKTRPQIVSVCTSMKPRTEILLEIASGDYGVQAIWAEKPLTYSLEQADEVIAACRKAGIHLAVNCTHRWRDSFTQTREMIDDGLIGDVIHVQGGFNCNLSHNGSHLITRLTTFTDAPVAWVAGEAESDAAVAGDDDFAGKRLLRLSQRRARHVPRHAHRRAGTLLRHHRHRRHDPPHGRQPQPRTVADRGGPARPARIGARLPLLSGPATSRDRPASTCCTTS